MNAVTPGFGAFCALSRRGNLIPVYTEVLADLETPVSSFLKIADGSPAFLLESVEGGERQARFSFLGNQPDTVIEASAGRVRISERGGVREKKCPGDPLPELEGLLRRFRFVPRPELPPFCGGAVGFLSYDCNRFYERIGARRKRRAASPDMYFMIAGTIVIFDHVRRRLLIVTNAYVPRESRRARQREIYEAALVTLRATLEKLRGNCAPETAAPPVRRTPADFSSNISRAQFHRAVARIKRRIRAGDVIQVVLSRRFRKRVGCNGFQVYRALRSLNPSPYMFYLKTEPDFELAGSSPEVHVRCEGGTVTLRPIAGTRPRGRTPAEDRRHERVLLADPKEKAEHLMLVDLGRNDLGRVSEIGSVNVDRFMTVERYSHVMHLVSEISSRLRRGSSPFDVIRATFPAGTVSGAPKVRAMEIIDALEPERRGPYAGLVGYFSFSGNFDSCITIRTAVLQRGEVSVQAGAGVVADSAPEREWLETRNKALGVLRAVEAAERGLWGHVP